MVALTYRYERTDHIRKEILGGMDSEYSHSEVNVHTLTVVVPRDDKRWREAADTYVKYHASNSRDENFKVLSGPELLQVNVILSETLRLT